MPSLTIKGIPEDLCRRLRNQAAAHRRSLNSEIIVCLEHAAGMADLDPGRWLRGADRLRTRLNLKAMTEAGLRRAKAAGRP